MSYDLKDKVAIIGAGCTKFGENFEMSYGDLLVDAAFEAFEEAGVGLKDIEAAWLSTSFPDLGPYKGRWGGDLSEALSLYGIPVTKVANYCGAAGDAIQNAVWALLSGRYNVVMAIGCEKLRDRAPRNSLIHGAVAGQHPLYQKGVTAAGSMSIGVIRRMFEDTSLTREHLAKISVKNHCNGKLNPKAHFQMELTVEQVLKAPMVAYPLTVLDACPTTDGAAAVIMVRKNEAKAFNKDYVLIKGLGFVTDAGWDLPFYDITGRFLGAWSMEKAKNIALEQAGIKNPVEELDFAEVHDAFSWDEILEYEMLGFCKKGEIPRCIDEGIFERDGKLPVNVSGGLLSCGHPVGATGLRMAYELTRHLQGKAGERQIKNARLGMMQNTGGPAGVTAVIVLGAQ